jgi:hypothetical protein
MQGGEYDNRKLTTVILREMKTFSTENQFMMRKRKNSNLVL